jgi:hypothetical protein
MRNIFRIYHSQTIKLYELVAKDYVLAIIGILTAATVIKMHPLFSMK